MIFLIVAAALCARADDPTSLDDARARRTFAAYLGAYESVDTKSRATVTIADGFLKVWRMEDDQPAEISFEVEHSLLGEMSTVRAYDVFLGWHFTERFVTIADGWLIYSVKSTGLMRRRTEQWGLHLGDGGVDFHHQRLFEHRGVFDLGGWYVDLNSPEASVLSENIRRHLVRLSPKPIPVDEFVKLAAPAPAVAPAPEMGRVIPFPVRCDKVLDR